MGAFARESIGAGVSVQGASIDLDMDIILVNHGGRHSSQYEYQYLRRCRTYNIPNPTAIIHTESAMCYEDTRK